MTICTLCRNTSTSHLRKIEDYDYFICKTCDLVFVDPNQRLAPSEEKSRYDLHENNPEDERYRSFLSQLLKPLQKKLAPKSSGLDYGAGPGPTLHLMFEEYGHSMEIYDPFYANHSSVLDKTYDFITSTETVEHFFNPSKEFDRLWSVLKPGGYLGIMTLLRPENKKISDWHYLRDETHVSFYSKQTFNWIAKQYHANLWFYGDRVIILKKSLS